MEAQKEWFVDTMSMPSRGYVRISTQDGYEIRVVDRRNGKHYQLDKELQALVTLIAAAPRMLDELNEDERILLNLLHDLDRIAGVPVMRGIRKRLVSIRKVVEAAIAAATE